MVTREEKKKRKVEKEKEKNEFYLIEFSLYKVLLAVVKMFVFFT